MQPNVFLISPYLGQEDALTAFWHYTLSVVPGLGQSFLDYVSSASGLASSRFIGVVDHPRGSGTNHPDLLLQTSSHQILFEHKLGAPFGPRQLNRYLALATQKRWKLAVLAANRMDIDDEVLRSAAFVRPKDASRPAHFLWQELHPVLASADNHIAREFIELLEVWGLGRFSWGGRGDPFVDPGARDSLVSLYDVIKAELAKQGVPCRKSANSSIYQVRTPFPPVHLINIGPLQSVAQSVPAIRGPAMGLWGWVRRTDPERRVLTTGNTRIQRATMPIAIKDHEDGRRPIGPYAQRVFAERTYYTPLGQVLHDSLEESRRSLVKFVLTAMGHLRREVADLHRAPEEGNRSSVPRKRGLESESG